MVLDLMGRDEEEGLRREAALGALPVLAQVLPMQVGSQAAKPLAGPTDARVALAASCMRRSERLIRPGCGMMVSQLELIKSSEVVVKATQEAALLAAAANAAKEPKGSKAKVGMASDFWLFIRSGWLTPDAAAAPPAHDALAAAAAAVVGG